MAVRSSASGIQLWLAVLVFTLPSHPSFGQAIIDVDVDILPHSLLRPNATVSGEVPVAILGSDELDVSGIDVTTLSFGPGPALPLHEEGGHLEDVNDDGFPDLVSHYLTDDAVIVDLGLGSTRACVRGGLIDGTQIEGCDEISITPTSFLETDGVAVGDIGVAVVGDFDGDGDPDVVASLQTRVFVPNPVGGCRDYQPSYRLDNVVWYENVNGRGAFSPAQPLLFDLNEITTISLGDVDGDEDLDLVVGTAREGALTLYPNADGQGTLAPPRTIATNIDPPRVVEIADLDGDDDVDIAWSGAIFRECLHTDGSVGWFENTNGMGDFSAMIELRNYFAYEFDAADVDGDGDSEIVTANHRHPAVYNIINTDQIVVTEITNSDCGQPYLVDLDHDSDLDLVCERGWVENTGSLDGVILYDGGDYSGVPDRSVHSSIFDVDLDGDVDYVNGYVGPLAIPPTYDEQQGATIWVYERRDDPEWEYYLTSGAPETYGFFLSPTYLHPDDNGDDPYGDFRDGYRDGVTDTIPVDMDGDGDTDLVIVAPGMNQIFWFANSLLTPAATVPVANAGVDRIAIAGDVAQLDGSASYDLESDPLSFAWDVVTTPEGATAELTDADGEAPTISTNTLGAYVVQLVVSDSFASSLPDTMEFLVVSAEERFAQQMTHALEIIGALGADDFASEQKRDAFVKELDKLVAYVQKGRISKATRNLQRSITQTDGCAQIGRPDGDGDIITNCDAQAPVYETLTQALTTLAHPTLTKANK